MISGDNERTARHIAARAGIPPERVVAGVKPEGKAEKVAELESQYKALLASPGGGGSLARAAAAAGAPLPVQRMQPSPSQLPVAKRQKPLPQTPYIGRRSPAPFMPQGPSRSSGS